MSHLARRHAITGDLLAKFTSAIRPGREKRLRDLWELTELPADEFADEVAQFYKLPRLELAAIAGGHIAGRTILASFPARDDGLSVPAQGRRRPHFSGRRSDR